MVAIFLLAVVTAALGQSFTVGKYQVTGGNTMRSDAGALLHTWLLPMLIIGTFVLMVASHDSYTYPSAGGASVA
jgi:hypothetical protein